MSQDVRQGQHQPVSIRGLTKDFGATRAVDDVTFDVPAGSVTGFIGGNGSGKTTTLRVLCGLTAPTVGEALIMGLPYRQLEQPRRRVGAVLDRIGAHPGHTGRQHLRLVAKACDIDESRIDVVLGEVELLDAADIQIRRYSMGMQQRCALAVALLHAPPILILDEPANGLDPSGIRWLRTTIRRWADEGRAVLVSSHQLAELSLVVDRVVVLDRGAMLYSGLAGDLIERGGANPKSEQTMATSSGRPTLEDAVTNLILDQEGAAL